MNDPYASYSADAIALHAVDTDDGDGLYAVRLRAGPRAMAMTVECPICGVQPDALCMSRDGRSFGLEYVHERRAEAAPEQCPHYWNRHAERCLRPEGHVPTSQHLWPPGCGAHGERVPAHENAPEPSPTVRSTATENPDSRG